MASSNGAADTNIGFAEGQTPASVNDGVRALMAALKGFANQILGAKTTGGSSNAYTFTSDSVAAISTSYAAGMGFVFKANHTNTGASTLNVDSVGATAIRKGGAETALSANDIVANGIYFVVYNGTYWILLNPETGVTSAGYQPLDAQLTALAGISPVSGDIFYWTGATSLSALATTASARTALTTMTAAGLALIDDADASAQRTTLGLGTSATVDTGTSGTKVALTDGANTWSAAQVVSAQASRFGSAAGDYTAPTTSNTNVLLYQVSSTNWAGIGIHTDGTMYFVTGTSSPATRMYITPAGVVAVGGNTVLTTATGAQLSGASFTGAVSVANSISSTGASAIVLFQDRAGSAQWGWYNSTTTRLWNGSADVLTIDSSGNLETTTLRGRIPLSSETSGTLTSASSNKRVKATGGVTINDGVHTAEDAIEIYNDSDSSITLTQDTGMTLRLAGTTTTGNRTLAARAIAYVYFDTNADAAVGGSGVS